MASPPNSQFSARHRPVRMLWIAAVALAAVSGCTWFRGGVFPWFGSRDPEPSRTVDDFLDQPRPGEDE